MADKNDLKYHHPNLLQTITGKGFFRTQMLWFLAISLVPLAIASFMNYRNIHQTLRKEIVAQLNNTAYHKTTEIKDFFDESMKSLNWEARRESVRIQLQTLTKSFNKSGKELHDFIYSREWTEITGRTADQFEFFLSINELYDVFLIDDKGNILYTAAEESDLGTNIFTGPYSNSHLEKACRTAINKSRSVFSDFDKYEPSDNVDACFLVSPVYSLDGKLIGLMAIQLSTTKIDRIMQRNDLSSNVTSFLIGQNLLMRSHTYEDEQDSTHDVKIETLKTKAWQKHIHEPNKNAFDPHKADIYQNHKGIEVLGLFSVIEVSGVPLAVITEIPVAAAFKDVNRQTQMALVLFISVAGIILLLAFWAAKRVTRPLHILTRQANRIADGDLEVMHDSIVDSKDEFGLLNQSFQKLASSLRDISSVCSDISLGIFNHTVPVRSEKDILSISVNRMIESFQDVIAQANSISTGDFSVTIVPRSQHDTLSIALRKMATSLDEQDWIKSGIAELSNRMQGEQDVNSLSQSILNFIGDYLRIQVGAFFILTGGKLRLHAGYALKIDPNQNCEFALGEGLIGQAAIEKKIITFDKVPAEHVALSINSGLGASYPSSILIVPLSHNGIVKGIMEFGACREFTELEKSFLELVNSSIAINIHTAESRQELQLLLEETQRQSEELQSQQEELRVANEELEEQSEELRAANEELEEKTEFLETQRQEIIEARKTLEIKADELEKASKYKSEFLANMSHELRSPLNSLLILARSLADNAEKNLTEEQLEAARIIYSSGRDQLNLINDILDLSKVEAGRLEIHPENLTLSNLKNDIEDRFSHQAKEKNLQFKIDFNSSLPETIFTDEQRLKQILINLLSNAIKFTNQGSVTLKADASLPKTNFKHQELKNASRIISFSVIDTGIGISPDKQEAIFEAFRQEDGSTSRSFGGTGLGLTISRQLANLLGGEIHLDSKPGKGCNFTLYLPASKTEKDLSPSVKKNATDTTSTTTENRTPTNSSSTSTKQPSTLTTDTLIDDDRQKIRSGDKSLLIIEDDPIFAQIILQMARDNGYKVLAAPNGRSGILLAKEYHPKAIILDLGLPDLDGISVLENLKKDLDTRHIPVHIVSASEQSSLPQLKGAVGFLRKPATSENMDKVFSQFDAIIKGGVKKLLIVDDDKTSRNNIRQLLAHQGVEIFTAATGEEAYNSLISKTFDCIILDLGLPDMSGFDLLAKLDREGNVSVPVIVYTGRDLTEKENECLQKYAQTVVVKGAESNERLLDEVSLFIHSMAASLPPDQRHMIQMIHDSDEVLKDKRILLVDDDMRNTFALSGLLQKLGMSVTMAANGQQALDKLETDEFDLVLMDIMMPIMDGYEATRLIKEQKRFHDLPIIALTAKAMPEDRQICLDAGANDYLAKPIDQERLLSLMRVWLFK